MKIITAKTRNRIKSMSKELDKYDHLREMLESIEQLEKAVELLKKQRDLVLWRYAKSLSNNKVMHLIKNFNKDILKVLS